MLGTQSYPAQDCRSCDHDDQGSPWKHMHPLDENERRADQQQEASHKQSSKDSSAFVLGLIDLKDMQGPVPAR